MQIIENLKPQKSKRGTLFSVSLFLCPFCKRKVIKHRGNGIRDLSCGCLLKNNKHNYKHGGIKTRLYKIWSGMKYRCYNKKSPEYYYYGKRGIKICSKWKNDFASFQKWAVEYGYQDKLTIDRKNNDKGYFPSNCHWVTIEINNRNKRNVKLNMVLVKEIRQKYSQGNISQKELAFIYKVDPKTIYRVIHNIRWREV